MNADARYSIADLARVVGVTPRTVRYYVAQGLLPGANDAGQAAWYDERHLGRLRLVRELQRRHLPLAEIRSTLASMADVDVAIALQEREASTSTEAGPAHDSALDYIRGVLGSGTAGRGRTPAPKHAVGTWSTEPPPKPTALMAAASSDEATTAAPPSLSPPPSPTDRSQWDRIAITPDIELHVRRPLSRPDNKRVERLITIARQVLKEDPS